MYIPTFLLLLTSLTPLIHALPQNPRSTPSKTSAKCTIGGCNREICTKASSSTGGVSGGVFSPCIYKPEFQCYADAACVYDLATDTCAWSEDTGLRECIAEARRDGEGSTATVATITASAAATDATSPKCTIGGCNREVCTKASSSGDDGGGVVSPCIYKPEFQCYADAACVYDLATDTCAWSEDTGLRECIAEARREGLSLSTVSTTTVGTPLESSTATSTDPLAPATALAAQFSTDVSTEPTPISVPRCRRTGCNSELCVPASSPDVRSTCVWRPVYACYKFTECAYDEEKGACAFAETRRLQMCRKAAAGGGGRAGPAHI